MKRILLLIALVTSYSMVFSQDLCPTQFLRNNGNSGPCASHIRLYFASCPYAIPSLDSIATDGVIQPETFTVIGQTCHGNNDYIDYCISDNNLPPAARVTVFLTYPGQTINASSTHITCTIASAGPTPVVLSSFTAQRNENNDVILSWTTQQEINSSFFSIERSYNNANFGEVGIVTAAGNSSIVHSYSFNDNSNNNTNESFYRIKMVDKDGRFTYTPIRTVSGSSATADYKIYPNPAIGNSKITISQLSGPSVIKVFDYSGRMIKSVSVNNPGNAEINGLVRGMYLVQINDQNSGKMVAKKLSVVN